MSRNRICDDRECTGCGACAAVCAHRAVAMEPDAVGFLRPRIVAERCVDCGLCRKVCPALHRPEMDEPSAALALCAKDEAGRRLSSSGGAAVLLTQAHVEAGGVAYACVQRGDEICHVRIDDAADVPPIRGSKYVQSHPHDTFRECMRDLKDGKRVLYIGTPCQIAGLKAFLQRDYEALTTVDLVCHGVPSQKMLRDNIDSVGGKQGMSVAFRKKADGKVKFGFYLYADGKETYARDYPNDYFISGFLKGIFFRPNCFECRYACPERVSDLTIGDFWGLGKMAPSHMNASKGVSLVLVNSPKGEALVDSIRAEADIESRPVREAVEGNGQLRHSFNKPADYDDFMKAYAEHGYDAACKTYLTDYMRRNRMTMLCEKHPYLMLPYRIFAKLFR